MKRTALAALVCSACLAWSSAAGAVPTENWESSLNDTPLRPLRQRIGEELLLDKADEADKTTPPAKPSKSAERKDSAKKDGSQKSAKSDKAQPSSDVKEENAIG